MPQRQYIVSVHVPQVIPLPVITSTSPLPNAPVLVPYSFTFSATGFGPFTWSSTPTGAFSLNPVTGQLTGTPSTTGTFNFTVTVFDALSRHSAPVNFSLTVQGTGQLFDFYVGPNGDDSNPGTLAQPWSVTALGTVANRNPNLSNTTGCKWAAYSGKRVGMLAGHYTKGSFNGSPVSLFSLVNSVSGTGILVNGGPNSSTQTYIGACDSNGLSLTGIPGPPTVMLDFSNDNNFGISGVNSVTQWVQQVLMGQSEAGLNGATFPPHWGNLVLDGIGIYGGSQFGFYFGNGIGGTTYGNQVTLKNCEVAWMYGFHNNNPGALYWNGIDQGSGAQELNCCFRDCYSTDQGQYQNGQMSFSGNIGTLVSGGGSGMSLINTTPFVYGAGLPAGFTIVSLATGSFGVPGSTYNMSASVTSAAIPVGFGWAGSIPGPYANNAQSGFNNKTIPTTCINVTVGRTGAHILKTQKQPATYEYCHFEFGNFAFWTGATGPGGQTESSPLNVCWAQSAGFTSIMKNCVIVGGFNCGNDDIGNPNSGAVTLQNNLCYMPQNSNRVFGTAALVNDGATGTVNQSGCVIWDDSGQLASCPNGYMLVSGTGSTSDNNYFQAGATFTQSAFGALKTLSQWITLTGLEAHSTTFASNPFVQQPVSMNPASYALTNGKGPIDGSVSSLGYPCGCTFALALPPATVGVTYTTALSAFSSVAIIGAYPNFGGWLTGNAAIPPGGYVLAGQTISGRPQQLETETVVVQGTLLSGQSVTWTYTLTVFHP